MRVCKHFATCTFLGFIFILRVCLKESVLYSLFNPAPFLCLPYDLYFAQHLLFVSVAGSDLPRPTFVSNGLSLADVARRR